MITERRRQPCQRGATARRVVSPQRRIDPRRLTKPMAVGFFTAAVVLVGWQVRERLELPVRHVAIDGEFRYLQREAVELVLAPYIQRELPAVPLDELRRALEGLAWVDRATVTRIWPDGLKVAVEEQKPIAWWGRDLLMNNRGGLFAPEGLLIADVLPRLEGPDGTQLEVMERYIDLGQVLGSRKLGVQSVSLNAIGSWTVALKSKVVLIFGRHRVTEKLQRFLAVYDRVLIQHLENVERVDLRYQNGLAVRWRQQHTSESASVARSGRVAKQLPESKHI